jgi:hypothetical protein
MGNLAVFPDVEGIDTVYAALKATFVIGVTTERTSVTFAETQVPVTLEPEYHGEPGLSSLKRHTDLSLEKPGTDIVVMGHAWAPNGRAVQVMDIGVRVGPVTKVARVFGDRVWTYAGVGFQATAPEPFEVMPIVWERAYGGIDVMKERKTQESRNPVGTGFRVSEGGLPVEGVRLPNIEDPRELISAWNQQPAPMGFAPIDASWEPRRSYAGTYDEQWERQRAPYLPADFDPRFLQIAPPDMIAPRLDGGEWVDLRGLTREGVMQFQLPRMQPRVVYVVDGSSIERPAVLDTVIIEPDAARLQLVWRAALKCDKKVLRVSEVEVSMSAAA